MPDQSITGKYFLEHIFVSCSHSLLYPMSIFIKTTEASLNEQGAFLRRGTTRRRAFLGAASLFAGISAYPWKAWADEELGISRGAEAIRQEWVFQTSPKRVYEALTDAQQFDKVMRLSAAMRAMATGTRPAEISRDAGGAFSIFGGYVTGLQIELVPVRRIVQVWRSQSWKPGDFSIAKFEIVEQGAGSKIVLEHRGFPDGTSQHLAVGWRENYMEPMQQYLNMRA